MDTKKRELISKIKILNESIWENTIPFVRLERWLSNFSEDPGATVDEQTHALHLLSQFLYLGQREIRALLKALFRDLYRYPIIASIRRRNSDTRDLSFLHSRFERELKGTRFLGMGNPSESGTHLLYYFRQENSLGRDNFINSHEIFRRDSSNKMHLRDSKVRRYVFIDDLCGSGTQAIKYSQDVVAAIKSMDQNIHVSYYVLFATQKGLSAIHQATYFDSIDALFVLDESFKCFSESSRYFLPDDIFDRETSRDMCLRYGRFLWPAHPLGYKDGQLLLGFFYNVPDNTIPILWSPQQASPPWNPLLSRYPKIY